MGVLCYSAPTVRDSIRRDSRQMDVACKYRFHVIDNTQTLGQNAVDVHQGVLAPVEARAAFHRGLVTTPQHARNQAVLGAMLGVGPEELERLATLGVIGIRPRTKR